MREDEKQRTNKKTEIEDEEENDVNEEKWEREKSWDKPDRFYVFGVLLVYFSFWQLSAKGCRKNVWPSCFLFLPISFHFLSSFPLRFLSLSFPLNFFLFSFYSMLFYSIILKRHIYIYIFLHVCFTWSFCYFLLLPSIVFLFQSLFILSFIWILYYVKTQKLKQINNVCTLFWKKENLVLEKCLTSQVTIENPQDHQMITEFAKKLLKPL